MKSFKVGLLAMALVSAGTTLRADDAKGKCDAACAAGTGTCPVTAGMAKLPKLVYMVGTKSLCCEESAKAVATETASKLEYVVGTEKFDSSDKAFASLVAQTEKYVTAFATPSTCSISGQTTIAGESLTCSVAAGEVASKVKKAMDRVVISYKVGGQSCNCPVEAKALAISKKAKTLFVVENEETECDQTARLNLARAKYKAALLAMVPAKPEAKTAVQ